MSEYEIGKEMAELEAKVNELTILVRNLYEVVQHNIDTKKIVEPPKEKKE